MSNSSSEVNFSQLSPSSALQDEINLETIDNTDLNNSEANQWPPPPSYSHAPLSKVSQPILTPKLVITMSRSKRERQEKKETGS